MAQNCNYEILCLFYVHVYTHLQPERIRLVSAWQTEDAWERLLMQSVDAVRASVISETLALGRCLTDVFPTPIPNKPPGAPHTSFHLCARCVCASFSSEGTEECGSVAVTLQNVKNVGIQLSVTMDTNVLILLSEESESWQRTDP